MKKFSLIKENSSPLSEQYIVLVFNAGIKKSADIKDNDDEYKSIFMLKSDPIYIKDIKKTMKIINHRNMILGMQAGCLIEVEKHGFTDWKELGLWD